MLDMSKTILHAQPYDLHATGFYFEDAEDYERKAKANVNEFGDPVEEYEIQFIDGEDEFADALGSVMAYTLNQANFVQFFEALERFDDEDTQLGVLACMTDNHEDLAEVMNRSDDELRDRVFMSFDCYKADECVYDEVGLTFFETIEENIPEDLRHYFDHRQYGKDIIQNNGWSIHLLIGRTVVVTQP